MWVFRVRILEKVEMGVRMNVNYLTVDRSPQDPGSMT
jgi:hypothetical protein